MEESSDHHSPNQRIDEIRGRKRHTKSRKGCNVCKRRKVKCDEGKPSCSNCIRHGSECDFNSINDTAPAIATSSADYRVTTPQVVPTSPFNSAPTPNHADERSNEETADVLFAQTSTKISSLELTHLELLHNYITLTSQTLSGDPVLKNVWRINVPNVGFTNDFVMRSIFALSALHMSLYSTRKRQFYLDIARCEHGAALREISQVLSSVTAENCSAVYIAAALTFFYAWASPRQPGDFFLVSNSGTAEWVFLLHGVRSITESWRTELCNGPFSPMFRLGGSRIDSINSSSITSAAWLSTAEHAQLVYLRRLVAQAATDTQLAETYERSIENLETSFCAVYYSAHIPSKGQPNGSPSPHGFPEMIPSPAASTSNIYSWLYRMSNHFIELLNQRDPPTLVIFAHFCVLLKHLSSCWWMQGWTTHLLQEIWDLLDEEHRLWIRWPIEETGWVPRN